MILILMVTLMTFIYVALFRNNRYKVLHKGEQVNERQENNHISDRTDKRMHATVNIKGKNNR